MIDFSKVNGVIHIGASEGQERFVYDSHDLNVLWIEPIPSVFKQLENNTKPFRKQKCLNYLLCEEDLKKYSFHISNNNGESSSIFDLNLHKRIWPSVHYVNTIEIVGRTLPSIIEENKIDIKYYDMINLDTQGSELLILKASVSVLSQMKYVYMEVADMDSYAGGCKLEEVDDFFESIGYGRIELIPDKQKNWITEGKYYQALYQNESSLHTL